MMSVGYIVFNSCINSNCNMMESININIRKATKQDCAEIIRLVQELADFEKMSNSVNLDAERCYIVRCPINYKKDICRYLNKALARDGFETNNPPFHCLVIDDPQTDEGETPNLIAYALYSFIYGTWLGKRLWLEDIMVTEKYKCKGIGKRLFSAVCKEALRENAKAVRFVVLKWNPAVEFYKKFGTTNLTDTEEWQFSNLDYEDVIKTANLFE